MAQGIFSTYRQGENRVTSSIINVLRRMPIVVVEELLQGLFDPSGSVQHYTFTNQVKGKGTNQVKGNNSVPDAEISSSFRYLIETKTVRGSNDKEQLENHLELLNGEGPKTNKKLLFLTPDEKRPELGGLDDGNMLVWKSFDYFYDLIDEVISDQSIVLSERDTFLLRELQILFEEDGLLTQPEQVLIVAAGIAYTGYENHSIYVCQADRSFRKTKHIGFYVKGKIQKEIPEILAVVESISYSELLVKIRGEIEPFNKFKEKKCDFIKRVEGYQKQLKHEDDTVVQFMFLSKKKDDDKTKNLKKAIENDLTSSSGRKVAFTQGQRYVQKEKLFSSDVKTTRDLLP